MMIPYLYNIKITQRQVVHTNTIVRSRGRRPYWRSSDWHGTSSICRFRDTISLSVAASSYSETSKGEATITFLKENIGETWISISRMYRDSLYRVPSLLKWDDQVIQPTKHLNLPRESHPLRLSPPNHKQHLLTQNAWHRSSTGLQIPVFLIPEQ